MERNSDLEIEIKNLRRDLSEKQGKEDKENVRYANIVLSWLNENDAEKVERFKKYFNSSLE